MPRSAEEADDARLSSPARAARRRWALRSASVAFGFFVALAIAEVALRMESIPWSLTLSNYMTSCYEADAATPIWYLDPRIELRWPRPHVETRCGFNRLIWHHRSDQLGHRNPEDWPRVDVALLGDSMVYGHGVEEAETAAHLLRTRLGKRVANLGQPEASPVDYLMQVKNVVPALQPRVVVMFLYRNDVQDLLRARTPEELRQFIETRHAIEAETYPPEFLLESNAKPARTSPFVRAASRLFSYRAARLFWLAHVEHKKLGFARGYKGPRDDALGLEYIRAATAAISESLQASGSRLVVGYMPTSAVRRSNAEHMGKVVRELALRISTDLSVPFFDGSACLAGANGNPDPSAFLHGDWHLTPSGHRRLADALASFLVQERLLE